MPQAKNTFPKTMQERDDRVMHFCAELMALLLETREEVASETQDLSETRELVPTYDSSLGLLCIEAAAQKAQWHPMVDLTRSFRAAVDKHDSLALKTYLKVRANKQKRVEQEGSLPQEPTSDWFWLPT